MTRNPYHMTNKEVRDQLEALIDANSVSFVVRQIAEVCQAKEEHIAANWQDTGTAREWRRLAAKLDTVASSIAF